LGWEFVEADGTNPRDTRWSSDIYDVEAGQTVTDTLQHDGIPREGDCVRATMWDHVANTGFTGTIVC